MSPPPAFSDERGVVGLDQDILEVLHVFRVRSLEREVGMRVKGNEIDFCPQAP